MTDDDVNDRQLVSLYRDLSEMTKSKCDACPSAKTEPYRCCHKWACDLVKEYASWHWNTELHPTGNPDIPFMGPNGCIVPAHMRPMCTSHVCSIDDAADPDWKESYLKIKQAIADLEISRQLRVSSTSYGM
jgi:hypothetical protein